MSNSWQFGVLRDLLYLDWDENRALAVKAIWGLGKMPGAEAEQALLGLREDEDEIVREEDEAQSRRRKA